MQQELIIWSLGLALGLPFLILILGELVERLERQQNPLAPVVRQIRHVMLPVLALLLIMRHILSIEEAESSARLVATLFWMVVVYAVFNLVRALIQLGSEKPTAWHANVPPLFFALCRGAILFWVITHILSNIWGVELGKHTTAIGVGSMGIALALQDTLSNLVSGFLLIVDRPFKEGDWCKMDGSWVVVQHVGWRATRFQDAGTGGSRIIPNGVLANQSIVNCHQEGQLWKEYFTFGFSYDDPPNLAKQAMREVAESIDELWDDYPVYIWTNAYKEDGIYSIPPFVFLIFGTGLTCTTSSIPAFTMRPNATASRSLVPLSTAAMPPT